MNRKFYLLSFALALTLALAAFISGTVSRSAASADSNALSALPASDIVITIDTQRLMNETLPVIFADKPDLLAKVNEKIEKFKKDSGIDPRTIDSIAVGLRFTTPSAKDFDAVVIARGHFNSTEVIDAGFTAAKNKHEAQKREEQYEGKTIFVLEPVRDTAPVTDSDEAAASSDESDKVDIQVKQDSEQMAVVALDANTIAAGKLKSVRATIDASMGRNRVDDELVRMATLNSSAHVGFSGRIPQSMSEKMAASSRGPEGKYFASIREFYGSFSAVGTDSETFVAVRTEKAGDAQDISQALNALKLLGGFGMGQSEKGAADPVAALLKGLSITTQDNEVQIKLRFNQKDLAPFIRGF